MWARHKPFAIIAGAILALSVAMIALCTPVQGERVIGGGAGTLHVTDSPTTWVWLSVQTRETVIADQVGISGLWDQLAQRVGHDRNLDYSGRNMAVRDAWIIANRYVNTGNCDEQTRTCNTPAPATDFPEQLTGGSVGVIATIAFIDQLTGGTLGGTLTVAATGGVTTDLTAAIAAPVLPVDGVEHKLGAAYGVQPDVVFIPTGSDIGTFDRDQLNIIEVGTIDDILLELCTLQPGGAACTLNSDNRARSNS